MTSLFLKFIIKIFFISLKLQQINKKIVKILKLPEFKILKFQKFIKII